MGQRLASMPDSTLERAAKDGRISDAARRAARREIERRERTTNHCPRGQGCADWNCERTH